MEKLRILNTRLLDYVNQDNSFGQFFNCLEKKLSISKVKIIYGSSLAFFLLLMVGFFEQLVSNLIGTAYPTYASIKAIESPEKEDDMKWLTYWVVFSVITTVEYFSNIILSWMPFYWMFKSLLLILCYLPFKYNGSILLYNNVIRPYFLKNESLIDDVIKTGSDCANQIKKAGKSVACNIVADNLKKVD